MGAGFCDVLPVGQTAHVARKFDRRRVAEAGLFGLYQRLLDYENDGALGPHELAELRRAVEVEISGMEQRVADLDGTPLELMLDVQRRELDRRAFTSPR